MFPPRIAREASAAVPAANWSNDAEILQREALSMRYAASPPRSYGKASPVSTNEREHVAQTGIRLGDGAVGMKRLEA